MRLKDRMRRTEWCWACRQWSRRGHRERCIARAKTRAPRAAAIAILIPALVLGVGLALLR